MTFDFQIQICRFLHKFLFLLQRPNGGFSHCLLLLLSLWPPTSTLVEHSLTLQPFPSILPTNFAFRSSLSLHHISKESNLGICVFSSRRPSPFLFGSSPYHLLLEVEFSILGARKFEELHLTSSSSSLETLSNPLPSFRVIPALPLTPRVEVGIPKRIFNVGSQIDVTPFPGSLTLFHHIFYDYHFLDLLVFLSCCLISLPFFYFCTVSST